MQRDDRDLARRLCLVLGEHRSALYLPGVQAIPLLTCEDDGGDLERLGSDLHGSFRVSQQVVVPAGVSGQATSGGEDDQAVAIGHVPDRRCPALSAPGSGGGEQEQGNTLEWSTDLACIRVELLHDLAVPGVHIWATIFLCFYHGILLVSLSRRYYS